MITIVSLHEQQLVPNLESRKVMQDRFYDPEIRNNGNCSEACVATLFGMQLKDIPKFSDQRDKSVYAYYTALEQFFLDRGYILHTESEIEPFPCLYLAIGPSARGCSHMVVMFNGRVIHDPHFSNAGLVKIDRILIPIPIDVFNLQLKAKE